MAKYRSTNPMTGQVVAEYPALDDDQIQSVLEQAQEAFLSWRRVEPAERTKVLSRVADLHRQHVTELAQLATLEMGKPVTQARGEVELAAAICDARMGLPRQTCREAGVEFQPTLGEAQT